MIIYYSNRTDTIPYVINQNSMHQNYYNQIVHYLSLPKYNQVKNSSNLYNDLISSSYKIVGDSVRIAFLDNNRFVQNQLDFRAGDNQIWTLDSFQNELFLVLSCNLHCAKTLFHITKIDNNSFTAFEYGKENKKHTFRKIPKQTEFKPHQLIGKWERQYDTNHQFPQGGKDLELPKSHPFYRKWYDKEHLIFNDSTFLIYSEFRIDTVNWSMNREQDLILFSNLRNYTSKSKSFWKIIELTKNKLILERWFRDFKTVEIEKVIFVRKE